MIWHAAVQAVVFGATAYGWIAIAWNLVSSDPKTGRPAALFHPVRYKEWFVAEWRRGRERSRAIKVEIAHYKEMQEYHLARVEAYNELRRKLESGEMTALEVLDAYRRLEEEGP